MRILFALSSPEYLRFYDDTIVELARRGHDVALAVQAVREGKPVRFDAVEGAHPRIRVAGLLPARDDGWRPLTAAIRGTMDFIRYLHPRLCHAAALRARVKRQALPWPLARLDRSESWTPQRVDTWMRRLERLERAVPIAASTTRFLRDERPDVVLVSPLVEMASDQVDVVRSAADLGVRTGTLVASWDNLTNKGDLRVATDRVFVWNEAQKTEAVELHRVDPARVVVTGAPPFDRWFGRAPSRGRAEFCGAVGLPDDAPFVLFTGSSIFIARAEVEIPFIRRWVEALRASADPTVRALRVLVRPHPYNGQAWPPDAMAGLAGVAVWPAGGYDPVHPSNRAGFFDSMFHAAAVVGVNTSAMIESAIVGRPVLSILAPEFARSQEGTLHFHHLLPENGGFLRVARTLEEHLQQLGGVLADAHGVRAELERFVGQFVRPHGLAQAAVPLLASAVEALGALPAPVPARRTVTDGLWRAALTPLARVAGWCPSESERQRRRRRAKRGAAQAGPAMPRREAAPKTGRSDRVGAALTGERTLR